MLTQQKKSPTIFSKKHLVFLVLLCAIGVCRIISTYHVFTQTADEPLHIARGMEWLTKGTYSHVHHPPLAPILVGMGPFIDGVRINWSGNKHLDGNKILYHNSSYFRNLSLARSGTLVFYLMSIIVVWMWARELFGQPTAAFSALIFSTLPLVLAHSGLATTDMAMAATLTLALYSFYQWLQKRSTLWGIVFGVASGLAFLSKFSALLFLPVCLLVIAFLYCLKDPNDLDRASFFTVSTMKDLGISALVAVFIIWAGYRFSLGTFSGDWSFLYARLERLLESRTYLSQMLRSIGDFRIIPAHEFGSGIFSVFQQNATGHAPYFLGTPRWSKGGSWLFFPIVFAVKSPIPFLIMAAGGVILATKRGMINRDWRILVPPAAAIAIFVSVLPSNINIGLRHILPVFPLLSIVAGFALSWGLNIKRWRFSSAFAAILLLWHIASGVHCHPDYLAYFNEFANRHPERIVVDSDLDWGQDLARLSKVLKEKNITDFSLAYFGSADIYRHGLPTFHELKRDEPTTGWVAVSLFFLKATRHYKWLSEYEPVATAGKSIWLYYIPAVK